jgi:uncharacterized membrane protein YhaH (DUF805 family)
MTGGHVAILASIAYSLAVLIPSYAVVVRRMHDTAVMGGGVFSRRIGFIYLFVDSQPGETDMAPIRKRRNFREARR